MNKNWTQITYENEGLGGAIAKRFPRFKSIVRVKMDGHLYFASRVDIGNDWAWQDEISDDGLEGNPEAWRPLTEKQRRKFHLSTRRKDF